eukprot:1609830-Alexandrium_andersonii.AAC.1
MGLLPGVGTTCRVLRHPSGLRRGVVALGVAGLRESYSAALENRAARHAMRVCTPESFHRHALLTCQES